MKSLREFESLYSFDCFGGTFVYNVCNVIDYLQLSDVDYFASGKAIKEFADKFNLSIYTAPKENFSYVSAVELCKQQSTCGVIVEDLS